MDATREAATGRQVRVRTLARAGVTGALTSLVLSLLLALALAALVEMLAR